MRILELFKEPTSKATWDWMEDYNSDSKKFQYLITLFNGVEYVLTVDFLTMGIWSVSFMQKIGKGGTTGLTGTGNATHVFSAILDCLRNFIRTMNPKALAFTASGSSRQKLYGRMAEVMAKGLGWTVDADKLEKHSTMYVIKRNDSYN